VARPTDWSKLGLDSDPTPGSQDTMAALAKILDAVQGKVDEMESTITAIVTNVAGGWTGKTADAMRGQISDQLQQFFRGLQQCFDEAAPAIHTYINAMAQHQADADTALTKALGLPDKDPGLAQYKQAATQAGSDLTAAGNTASAAVDDAVSRLASALTPSEIFWEAFQWLALILGVVGLIFGGPLAILAWLANIALFIKSIVDFAHGDTNFLGLFLGFLGIIAPMTRGIGGDLANLLKGGIGKLIGGAGKFAGDIGNLFGSIKTLFVDFSTIGVLGSIKVIGVLGMKGGLWVFDKILTFPTVITKIGVFAFEKFQTIDQYLISGLKFLGDGFGKGVDFVLTEIGTGRFVRLFLPVTKDEFTALNFSGALWRSFERTLPGIVPMNKVLDDQFTLFQLTKGLNMPADAIAKITLNVRTMHDFNPADGVKYVPMPNGTLFVPEKFLTSLKLNDISAIDSLIKPGVLDPHFTIGDLGNLGKIDPHFNVGNLDNLSTFSKLRNGDLSTVTVHGIEQLDGFKPIEITNLAHADSIAVVKIGDSLSLSGVEKEIAVAKVPTFTGVDHIATADLHEQIPRVEISAAAAIGSVPIHDVLSLVKNVELTGGNLADHSPADIGSLTTSVDHSLAGQAGALHGLGAENIAVRAEPIGGVNGIAGIGGFTADHLAIAKQAFDHQITAFAGKIAPDALDKMGTDFFAQIKDVHSGWRDPRLVDPRFSELQVNRLIGNLPKQFTQQFERTGWINDLGKGVRDDPGYLKLSIDGKARFDQEIATRVGSGFDRVWSAKNAAFGAGTDLPALKLALAADLRTALGKALERDDWMRKAGAAFEHGLGENAGIAGKLPPAELAKFRQDFLGGAEKIFQDAKANDLTFTADIQDGLAGALTHDMHSKLADQIARISKINSNGLKGRAIASDWAVANPHEAALVGDAGIQRLLHDLGADLRKIPPGSRPQIFNQVLKNFEGKLAFEADLRTVLADAAHAFHGVPGDAAKFRETTVLDFLSGHGLPSGMPHGMTPDVAKGWLSWEKDNGDVFGSTLSQIHPVDKNAAWSQARIDLAKDVQPKINLERQIAPKITTALDEFDTKLDQWAEDHGPASVGNVKAWREEFDKILRDAGPAVLNDPLAFDRLTRNLLDGLDGRLGSDPEAAALKGQADIRFQDAVKDWAGKTGGSPSFFGFTKLTEDFQAHIGDLLGAARHGLGDGGGLDVAKFAKGLDDHLAGFGAKLEKEAGLGNLEADAFEKAYGGWLGHDVPLDDGFSADRLTDLAAEFRTVSRTLTDHLGADEAKPIIDDLASRLPERFDLELRSLSRVDAADDAFTHGLQDWHNPAGMRDLTDPEIGQVRTEFTADAKDLTKVPDTFWTGARLDAKQIRALVAGWDSRLGDLASAVPGRLNFEAHLLDELSHASELLGEGVKFDHIVQDFREDFTHQFHDVWGNGRNADDWLAKEQQTGDVFTNGPGVQIPKTSLELRPLDPRPVAPEPRPQTVAGTWGRPVDLSAWGKAWHDEVDAMFTGNGILSIGTVKDGVASGGNRAIMKMFNDNTFSTAAKVQLQTDLDALHRSLSDPQVSSAAARPLLQNLFDHNLKGDSRASKFPVSAMNDALESLNAKLLAEVHGGTSGLHPWPFNGSTKKPDYVLAGADGKVPKPGANGFGASEDTFFDSVTHVADHLKWSSVKDFADIGKGARSAVDSKLKAYEGKQVRVVVDLTKSPGLEPGPGRDLTALIQHVTDEYRGGGPWDGPTRLIQSDLIVPGHFLAQPDPAVLTFRFRSDGLVYLDGAGAGWGHVAELGDHPVADPHPAVDAPSLDGGVFLHPDLPGGGRILPGGLLLSNQAKDLALAAKLPKYDGAFLLVTHFDDVRGQAHVNDVPVPHGLVGGYFASGLLPWREGQLIVVVGCGAEDLAAALRTELHTPTVGETHDFVMTHDGVNYTGPEAWSVDGPVARMSQPDWRPTPDVLEAGPHGDGDDGDGGARFKLFLPGDLETEPYRLGSDFGQAMRRLGFDPSSSVSTLDYLGRLAKLDDGPSAVKAGLQAFADKVFAAHLPPTESLKAALTDLGRPADLGVDWRSGGVPIDQDLRAYLRDLTDLEAKSPDAARDWRLTGLRQDPDLGQVFKDHLFLDGVPPRRLYFGHSDEGPDGNPVAGHDFVDVITRIERGTTPTVDIVHVGPGYLDRWTAALSDGSDVRAAEELKIRFGAAGASEIEVVGFDGLGKPGTKLGTLSTGITDGVHIRLTLVGQAATFKPLLKAGEPLVLVTGGKSVADALSAGKALLYQGLDHVGAAGQAHFLDQLAQWGTAIGGRYSPMTNMLYAFSKHDLFKDTTDPARLRIVADLAKGDLHLAPWREFSDLMAVGNDANVRVLGQASRKIWEQGASGPEIQEAVKVLTGLEQPTLKDLDTFEKRISGLVGTTGKWSADTGKDMDDLIHRMQDLHFPVDDRNYHVTVQDDEHNPTLQNPYLVAADLDNHLRLTVSPTAGGGEMLGRFCGYLSVHWLTQTDHSLPLGFKDLGGVRDDAVRTVTSWMTGAHGPDGNAAIDQYTAHALSGDHAAVVVGLDGFTGRLAGLPGGTRIVYSTNAHAMAAVLLDGGGVRVFDPDHGDGLIHFPDRQSFLDADFTQRANTFVVEDRVVTPPPPPRPPTPEPPVLKPPAPKPLTTEQPALPLAWPVHDKPDTTVDPLTHNPWAAPDPDRVVDKVTTFVDAVRDIKPSSPANPWSQITVLGRDGKPTGEVYAVDQLNGRWAKLDAADPDGAGHLWDGSRGPYLGKGGVTVRPNGDIVLIGEDNKPFFLKENLGDGRYVEVFRALDGKRHWFEWKGDGPNRELLYTGKRIYSTNADGAVFQDLHENGSIARDYRVTLDKGLIRAERGLGNQRGLWVWNRYDKDGNFVAKGIREYQGSAWKDTLTFGGPGAGVEVVVARQWSMWFTKWDHAAHFREHTIDIKDGKLGDPLKTVHTYKEISPQDKETGTSEFIGKDRILVVQRVAEQRVPTWFARHFAEIDVPKRGLFGGLDFPAGGVFGGDSRFQIYAWTEHEIVPGAHDGTATGTAAGKPVGAPIQRAGGMRVAIPDGSTFDFVTVTADGGKDTGVLVRAVVKLDDGTKLEVGRDLDSGKWASLADGVSAADGRTLNWRQVGSDKNVVSQGLRTFGPGHQWTDTLDDELKTVVRSTDDLGRVTSSLGRDTSLTRDPIGLITKRTDAFPGVGVGGKGEIVVGGGDPRSGKWTWEVTGAEGADGVKGADGAVTSGLRFPFRSRPDLGSWDDSFVDFQKVDGISKPVPIREIRALDKGRGLAAYKIDEVWHSDIRGLDGTVNADSRAIRQWKADDGTWGPNPKPGTDMQPWRDVPESAHGNVTDPPVLRTVVDGKVRLYDIKDGAPSTNVWTEFDHGGLFRAKKPVGVTPGGKEIYRETHAATGQWIETLADGTRIRYRSLNGFINTRDTFNRWSVRPDFAISGRWKTGGREYEYRGAGTEFRGYNRMWREPNRLEYRNIDGPDGQFVNPNWLKAQKVLLDFLQDYTFDVIANILITGAVNNWNFSPADWGKIFAGGAVTSGVKGASNAMQETLLKKFKDGVGNLDSGKFWGRAPYNHDKTWDNEWAGNENPRRWRSGLYDYGVNSLLTNGIAGFVSTAFTSTVFGIGPHHVTVSGLESLQAGGLGMAGALTGGLLAVGPRTVLHQLGSGRYFHQGGIPDLLITFGEKTFEKWFVGDVLGPALHLKITPPPPILGTGQGPWNG
jgi:uncharacterized protein YukE